MFIKKVAALLAIVPFIVYGQDYVSAENLLSSRSNEKISDGYLQCASVLQILYDCIWSFVASSIKKRRYSLVQPLVFLVSNDTAYDGQLLLDF